MLTPQEVSEKAFPKASFGGYNMASVDEFLDVLTEDYTALYKENAALKAKMKVLAEKVEEYRETEDAMRSTLLTAQKMATQLVQEAQTQKQQILTDAASEAAAKVSAMEAATRDAQQRLQIAKDHFGDFLRHTLEMVEGQAALLRELPEMDLTEKSAPAEAAAEAAAAPEESVGDTAVFEIEKNILDRYQKPAPEAAPAPANQTPAADPAPAAEPAKDDNPFASGFKMDLNDLKFGRNYSGNAPKK